MRRWFWMVLLVLGGCHRSDAPLEQQAYIWQRQWTPAVQQSLTDAADTFVAYRVLAAESTRSGAMNDALVDVAALAKTKRSVVTVFRINGNDATPAIEELRHRIISTISRWKSSGIAVFGVEIDYDCATSKLDAYAIVLKSIRAELPHDLKLSITALPTWIGTSTLAAVLDEVDESVLQVHAVSNPSNGLFDRISAVRWIDAYAKISPQPFRVALPAYGSRVSFDADGRATAVENEAPRDLDDSARELRVAAVDVQLFLHALRRDHPARLVGINWFRLPTTDDRRAWSLATLKAVIADAPLQPRLVAHALINASGSADVVLINEGEVDAPLRTITIAGNHCVAADALAGYRAEPQLFGWRFIPVADGVLKSGQQRRVGWVRCDTIKEATTDEHP